MDFSKQPDEGLSTLYNSYVQKIVDLNAGDLDKNGPKITHIEGIMTELAAEMQKRKEAAPSTPSGSTFGTRDPDNQLAKDMRATVDRVPILEPGASSTDFLASLENCFKNYVEERPSLEYRFVKAAVARMCDSYQTQVHGLEKKILTWSQLKVYVSDNYAVRLTPYQKMDQLFNLQVTSSDWTGYTVNLQNAADEVLRFVETKFEKSHPGEDLTSKKLFDIIAVQIFLRKLQEGSDSGAYDYICGQLHDVWDLNACLALAKNFIDRRNKSDSTDPVSENAAFYGQSGSRPGQGRRNKGQNSREKPKPSKTETPKQGDLAPRLQFTTEILKATTPGTCIVWANTGKCKFKDRCKYKHEWNLVAPETSPNFEKSSEGAFYAHQGFR